MKRFYMLFLAAAAAFVSCQESPFQEPEFEPEQNPQEEEMLDIKLEAGIVSKTVLDGTTVLWEKGDQLAMVFSHATEAPHVNKSLVNSAEGSSNRSDFNGRIPMSVSAENGYEDIGFVVYPHDAVTEDGAYVHNLPAVQTAKANGSFPSGCNLASTAVSLADFREDGRASADFTSAMSLLRLALSSDIESVTITGTAPLAGTAPLQMNNGCLLVDSNGSWSNESTSVTLQPSGNSDFVAGTYNVLVWPGTHNGLTIKVNFKNLGEYVKTSSKTMTFKPAKYYNLNFRNTEELVIEEVTDRLEDLEQDIPNLDEVEKNVAALLAQVQSVTLLTEYLDNAAYAQYGVFNNGMQKLDVSLDYIVKPESAAQALVDAFHADPSVVRGVLGYRKSTGYEDAGEMSVNDLVLSDGPIGKYVTASISAGNISKDFYDGKFGASVALQIKSGKTEILSDFANLVPMAGSAISGSYLKNIPVIPGARVVIPFNFAVSDPSASYTVEVASTENVDWATVNYNTDFRTGNLSVQINGTKAIESQNVTLALTIGGGENVELISHTFTFVDSGSRIDFVDPGKVDYIGGEVALDVTTQNIKNYMLSCSGAGVSQSGNIFTFTENTGAERTVNVECQATIQSVSLNFYKSITLTQKATGTSLSKTYYANGQKVVLNQATASCANKFNIVILGDGYQKKDLVVGGKFERSAMSAMDSFFSIEPYKTFKDRFNVFMVAYESSDEGTDIKSSGVTKNTYFNSYCQGGASTAAYVDGTDLVVNAVKAAVGNGDQYYYRSIAILLVNTDENAGSTGYPYRKANSGFVNGYSSFAIAVLAANSTGTNGLVKHEAGGHAFGRLADEYYTNGNTASDANKSDLSSTWHAIGWYWNVNPTNSGNYYKFTNSAYSSDEVSFIEGAWTYEYGIYRPTQGGMMQGSTGVFNAPSRHAIYHRIITESEGANAYSWSKFLEYDKKNR